MASSRRTAVRLSIGVVAALAACGKPARGPQRPSVPVTLTVAKRQAVPYTITASGIVVPAQTAVVSPQVDGIITNVTFHEGDEVRAGQLLFQIEPRPYAAAYQQAAATLARDRALDENARQMAVRYDDLFRNGLASQTQVDSEHTSARAADAVVQADSAAVATARFNLDNTGIRAPIGGRTGMLLVHVGNLVHAAGSTGLVTISQLHPIDVRFAVPASSLPLIQQYSARGVLRVAASHGLAQDSTVDSTVGSSAAGTDADGPGADVETGTLSFIDNAVDTSTGTVMLKASFANPGRTLWPGQFVSLRLRLFTEDQALVVPTQAVLVGQQGAYVYVVDSSGAAQSRPVVLERTAGAVAVIARGLREGEHVVAEGQSRLTPGARVSQAGADTGRAGAAGAGRRGGGRRGT
jgi:multidrug efflux system membrane fusion protein